MATQTPVPGCSVVDPQELKIPKSGLMERGGGSSHLFKQSPSGHQRRAWGMGRFVKQSEGRGQLGRGLEAEGRGSDPLSIPSTSNPSSSLPDAQWWLPHQSTT